MEQLANLAAQFPDLHAQDTDESGLDRREAALAHAIRDQTIRRWLTLRHLLQGYLRQPFDELEPEVAAGLLAGATQIFLMDRIPARAAINESVEWVKSVRGKGAGGLINAVLRRMAELASGQEPEYARASDFLDPPRNAVLLDDGRARRLNAEAFSPHLWSRLSQQYSVPIGIIERRRRTLDDNAAKLQVAHMCVRAPIVLNVEHAREPLSSKIVGPHDQSGHAVFEAGGAVLIKLMDQRGDVWVQDAASGEPVRLANELRPPRVLDLCAGMGTKSRQMAMTWPDSQIVATDKDATRFSELRRVSSLHKNLSTVAFHEVQGPFDLVLLDVPCTNTGVLARRAEARYRFNDEGLAELVELQRDILRRGWSLLAPGGHLLYATCSAEPEEGEDQALWAISALGGELLSVQRRLPSGVLGDPPARYCDGSYAALIRRP